MAAAARAAFTSGFELAVVVSVAVLLAVMVVVVAWLPSTRRTRRHHPWSSPLARPPADSVPAPPVGDLAPSG